jgi:hypothetical protein
MMQIKQISCPNCSRTSDIIIILSGNATLRVPIKKGKMCPEKHISLEPKLAGAKTFSASEKETKMTFFPEEGLAGQLHCKKCDQVFDIDVTG